MHMRNATADQRSTNQSQNSHKTGSRKKRSSLADGESMQPVLKEHKDSRKKSIEVDMMTYSQALARPQTNLTPQTLAEHSKSKSTIKKIMSPNSRPRKSQNGSLSS